MTIVRDRCVTQAMIRTNAVVTPLVRVTDQVPNPNPNPNPIIAQIKDETDHESSLHNRPRSIYSLTPARLFPGFLLGLCSRCYLVISDLINNEH